MLRTLFGTLFLLFTVEFAKDVAVESFTSPSLLAGGSVALFGLTLFTTSAVLLIDGARRFAGVAHGRLVRRLATVHIFVGAEWAALGLGWIAMVVANPRTDEDSSLGLFATVFGLPFLLTGIVLVWTGVSLRRSEREVSNPQPEPGEMSE